MIKVMIVDDSAVIRASLMNNFEKISDITVVDVAPDPYIAREKITKSKPDVLILDIEMPRMDGLTFLSKLMKHFPIPTIIFSSLTPKNSQTAVQAAELGAVEVVCKPGSQFSIGESMESLVAAVRSASMVNIRTLQQRLPPANTVKITSLHNTTDKLIAIGSSTGGPKTLEFIIKSLPPNLPPVVIVQHMPAGFTKSLSDRLNKLVMLDVKEATDGEMLARGQVRIAPGGFHLMVERRGGRYHTKLNDGPRVHFQKPAADILFHSVAKNVSSNAVGFVLTGMGTDGAQGLLKMKESGARTFSQDEASSVVYGMPKEAWKIGASEKQVPLEKVPEVICSLFK